MLRSLTRLVCALVGVAVIATAILVGALAGTARARTGRWQLPSRGDVQTLVSQLRPAKAKPSTYVYLYRDELEVIGGIDDARANESSLLSLGMHANLPRYRASNANWQRLVRCVQDKFVDYDVVISDQAPVSGDYILVKVGGRPDDLGMSGKALGGVAPFHGSPIPNSIVFAFDQGGSYRTRNNCQAAAHEIGHVYGLDHTRDCKDLMSYEQCGIKTFIDKPMLCGEHEDRACEDESATQNSAGRLRDLLGEPRPASV